MPKVNPDILSWARETAGLTHEEAVKRLNLSEARGVPAVERLAKLESGESEPTRPMLIKMAKQYFRPLLTFYMSSPPRQGNRGQDFRTLPSHSIKEDVLLDALIRNVQARQSMVRAVLEDEEEAEPLSFVGSVKMTDGVPAVVESIKGVTQIDLAESRDKPTPEASFAYLRSKIEAVGVFSLLIGDLGSYRTKIDLDTFRGFALADEFAPFVIINDQDSHPAWSFTLLHEVTHVWLGQTGVSGARSEKQIEKFCNDVAGELLLPSEELSTSNELSVIQAVSDLEETAKRISEFAQSRNLSSSMVAYKLFRSGSIDQDTWFYLSDTFRKLWIEGQKIKRRQVKSQEGGPSYYTVRRHRVGTSLIELVQRMMAGGALTTSKAGQILGVKAKNVQMLIDTL